MTIQPRNIGADFLIPMTRKWSTLLGKNSVTQLFKSEVEKLGIECSIMKYGDEIEV